MLESLTPLVLDACCVAAGVTLRRFQLVNDADGQAALKVVAWVTGPALVIQALCKEGLWTVLSSVACGYGILHTLLCHLLCWIGFRKNYDRQKALLMGCAVGSSVLLWGFPLAETVFGTVGLQAAILFNLSNLIAERVISYLSLASAGAGFPASYEHQDGGIYRGQWTGLNKEGIGSYKYKSGAVYEGEWKGNQKSGRGVYYFPTGGLYEGEWLNGNRNGVGVRTFSDGRMQVSASLDGVCRWLNNKCVSPLDVWQCTDAVIGATQAARAAREVSVGGGQISDAAQNLLQQPVLWATATAIAVNLLNQDLSPTARVLTQNLASMHRPLALLTAGFVIPFSLSRAQQIFSSLAVVGTRVVLALLTAAGAALSCYHVYPEFTPFVLPLMLVALSPVAPSVVETAKAFRLNTQLAATIVSSSSVLSAVAMFGVAAAMVITRLGVPHRQLAVSFAKIGGVAAGAVICAAALAALRFRQTAKKRLVLTRRQTESGSDVDTAGLQDMLQYVDASKSDSEKRSRPDEKRSPPPPQALAVGQLYLRRVPSRTMHHRLRGRLHRPSLVSRSLRDGRCVSGINGRLF